MEAIEGKAGDIEPLSGVLTRAFADDPYHRWLFREDRAWRAGSKKIWSRVLRATFRDGRLLTTSELAGAALWTPPNTKPRILDTLAALAILARHSTKRLPTLLRGLDLQERHKPEQPHWYLFALGTDPDHEGRGMATAVIRPILDLCDQQGLPAYLETSTAANVPFYERRGFEVRSKLDLPDGPHSWGMLRAPGAPTTRVGSEAAGVLSAPR